MNKEPSTNLLENIDWPALDRTVSRQQRNREIHSPGISLYRWWARRPHALIGEILDAAPGDWSNVSDPFSGGGTVAMEAAERELSIYAQDLHPWATLGLATTLDGVNPDALEDAGQRWLAELEPARRQLYGSRDGESEVITSFWVRVCACPRCEREAYLYPYPLVSLASRAKEERHGFFGCTACGTITRSALESTKRTCSGCGRRLSDGNRPSYPDGLFRCSQRDCRHEFAAFGPGYHWEVVLVQRLDGGRARIERPSATDLAAANIVVTDPPMALGAEIPVGLETQRLRRAGMTRWMDLYPPRQLESMLAASRALETLDAKPEITSRLRLILCGASEMAGYASRWDRYYPKAFEATANHRFVVTGFAAETNLLAKRGRGTLARRIGHSVRAAQWAQEFETPRPRNLSAGRRERLRFDELKQPTFVRGSSTRQLLPDDSVDLVLTDPPYFDDVQYAELGALFLVWAQATGLLSRSIHVDLRSEVVPNSSRGAGTERYCQLLTAVMRETKRTLKPDGRMVLTFHNTDGRAWWSLARALGRAGFFVSALAVAHAENETDHAKRGRRAFSRDLILECRISALDPEEVVIASEAGVGQSAELLAAGRAVAHLSAALASGEISRTWSYRRFGHAYRDHLTVKESAYIRFAASTKAS